MKALQILAVFSIYAQIPLKSAILMRVHFSMTHLKHDDLPDGTNFFFTSLEIVPTYFQTGPSCTLLFFTRTTSQNRRRKPGGSNALPCHLAKS